jgi:hypothetical protein
MKTQLLFSAVLIISLFLIPACNKDALVEKIIPLKAEYTFDTEMVSNALKRDSFEFNEIVTLTAKAVDIGDFDGFDSRGSRDGKDDANSFGNRLPGLAITGTGDSEIENWGSWYVVVDLALNPDDNSVTGLLNFTFPDYGDLVDFEVSGQPAVVVVGEKDDETLQLQVQLTIVTGTGRFANKTFDGTAAFLDVESLLSGAPDVPIRLVIEGALIDNPDGF